MRSIADVRVLGLVGGMLLAAASSSVDAAEPTQLSPAQLDRVVAGVATATSTVGGYALANGAYSKSILSASSSGDGDEDSVSSSGLSAAFALGLGPNATAEARTGGTANGDIAVATPLFNTGQVRVGPIFTFNLSVFGAFARSSD